MRVEDIKAKDIDDAIAAHAAVGDQATEMRIKSAVAIGKEFAERYKQDPMHSLERGLDIVDSILSGFQKHMQDQLDDLYRKNLSKTRELAPMSAKTAFKFMQSKTYAEAVESFFKELDVLYKKQMREAKDKLKRNQPKEEPTIPTFAVKQQIEPEPAPDDSRSKYPAKRKKRGKK